MAKAKQYGYSAYTSPSFSFGFPALSETPQVIRIKSQYFRNEDADGTLTKTKTIGENTRIWYNVTVGDSKDVHSIELGTLNKIESWKKVINVAGNEMSLKDNVAIAMLGDTIVFSEVQ